MERVQEEEATETSTAHLWAAREAETRSKARIKVINRSA
jgi:hypothetical protein